MCIAKLSGAAPPNRASRATIAFLESDRPDAPRAGGAYGDSRLARQAGERRLHSRGAITRCLRRARPVAERSRGWRPSEDASASPIIELFEAISEVASYLAAVARYRAGDQAAIVEAYGDLAEGTLRRYGSLVVALERIAAGKAVHKPLVATAIADVENRLGVWHAELLPALILRFLERHLRNAEAHANVVVDVEGTLQVRQRDGTVETVIPNHVYGRTAGLRSVLDGVDVAMNHASIRDEKHTCDLLTKPMPRMSESVFERVVQHAAEEHTPGSVSGVKRRDQTLTMTYHGGATYEELRAFANSLRRLLGPTLPVIHILDENGAEIEVFRPSQQRASAGRNDPCPCGSGKKYKRCHDA